VSVSVRVFGESTGDGGTHQTGPKSLPMFNEAAKLNCEGMTLMSFWRFGGYVDIARGQAQSDDGRAHVSEVEKLKLLIAIAGRED